MTEVSATDDSSEDRSECSPEILAYHWQSSMHTCPDLTRGAPDFEPERLSFSTPLIAVEHYTLMRQDRDSERKLRREMSVRIHELKDEAKDFEQLKVRCAQLEADAAKWKIVQNCMDQLGCDEREASIWTACSRLLISSAHLMNADTSTVKQECVTYQGQEIGDWVVTVQKISPPKEAS